MTNILSETGNIQWALNEIKRKLTDTEAAKIAAELAAIRSAVHNLEYAACQS